MGYIKAKSTPSLMVGTACGLLVIFLGYDYIWHFAPHMAFLLCLLIIWMTGRRYLLTRRVMPAMPIIVLSVLVAVVQLYVLFVVASLGR